MTSDEGVAQVQARLGDWARVWPQIMSVVIWCRDREMVVRAFEVCGEMGLSAYVHDLGASWTASHYHRDTDEHGEYTIARRSEPHAYHLSNRTVLPPAHTYPVSWTFDASD